MYSSNFTWYCIWTYIISWMICTADQWRCSIDNMMTSSNENISRVTGHLCGEFTGPGEFPTQRPVTRSFHVFFDRVWLNGWVTNREAGDLRRYRGHYDTNVMNNVTLKDTYNIDQYLTKSIEKKMQSPTKFLWGLIIGLVAHFAQSKVVVRSIGYLYFQRVVTSLSHRPPITYFIPYSSCCHQQ